MKKLIILPNLLDFSHRIEDYIPPSVKKAVEHIDGLIAESEKAARRFLCKFLDKPRVNSMPVRILSEHTQPKELKTMIEEEGIWGMISDCGLCCLADPGSEIIALCYEKNISLETYPGPSSIIMAIQLCGYLAQAFAFHGYLPKEKEALEKRLSELEKRSLQEQALQVWIETPYRFTKMIESAKKVLRDNTCFCVAKDLSLPTQKILRMPIRMWKKTPIKEEKALAVFLMKAK
jgi:16S rRNA (cytidine1402-2'-O)-methyltransferase